MISSSAGSRARTTRSRRCGARRTGSSGRRACSGGRSTESSRPNDPGLVFLENVDRLLKSPTAQRGRDFAIILACLSDLGYLAEWRVVNAADYGFPQRRRRVFLVAYQVGDEPEPDWHGPSAWLYSDGALARGLAVSSTTDVFFDRTRLQARGDLAELTDVSESAIQLLHSFTRSDVERQVWTRSVRCDFRGPRQVLRDILQPSSEVPESFFVPNEQLARWKYLKGPKDIPRVAKNGHEYLYSEGRDRFPRSDRQTIANDPHRRGRRHAFAVQARH